MHPSSKSKTEAKNQKKNNSTSETMIHLLDAIVDLNVIRGQSSSRSLFLKPWFVFLDIWWCT